jgi:hypothetical protein
VVGTGGHCVDGVGGGEGSEFAGCVESANWGGFEMIVLLVEFAGDECGAETLFVGARLPVGFKVAD